MVSIKNTHFFSFRKHFMIQDTVSLPYRTRYGHPLGCVVGAEELDDVISGHRCRIFSSRELGEAERVVFECCLKKE